MKRLWRWVFNGLTALSLLLCVTACVLWVKSCFHGEGLRWTTPLRVQTIPLSTGGVGNFDCYDEWIVGWDQGWLLVERASSRQHIDGMTYRAAGSDAPHVAAHFSHRYGQAGQTRIFLAFSELDKGWNRWGFVWESNRFKEPTQFTNLNYATCLAVVPCWFVAAVTLPLPAARLWRRFRRRKRYPPGRCPRCGYDLTGNLSGVCPECGTSIGKVAQ